ncbi:GNAT family N-acetyltransferase [Allosphingosinicella flava]|uniref:GNAT family N-acetyltransferase n=1 Tax=Allosphingosinicella flava TaxID=2771430 RepID=A0A7T2LLI8_9SPHN|nr:GNAT family N-acetyltransferase [Sphingosinicella flava]QPQ54082.1 GNAT family N-acetyltransferase [Sphingosinicella flava]
MFVVREARPEDAEALTGLIEELGYAVTAFDVAERLDRLAKLGQPALVADEGKPIGCLTWNIMPVLHRDTRVGRISMLVVTARKRSAGIGAQLVIAAEARMKALGCALIEVTSNQKRVDAHRFYERLGYERTSLRFGKTIEG